MLPKHLKLTSPAEFRRTIKGGSRAGARTVVVHYNLNAEVASAGPRFGLVVSKGVGNAVTRHAVSRKLRHVLREIELPRNAEVVVRALPAAASASSAQLRADIERALRKAAR